MTDQTITQLVIDSDTSGADDYSAAMDRVSDAAQKGTGSAAGYALAVAGVAGGVVAAIAALREFIDYVGNQTQALVDLQTHADIAGESLREFQETLFAARSKGVSDSDFTSGMDKIAADLLQAGQGVTQFSKLFEANSIAIRDQNGQLITTRQALTDIMGLMQSASPAVQQQIAKIVGLTSDWIPFLREGADQFAQQQQQAESLGVVIDDSTIAKAKEFNDQWKVAVATWDLQFKASIAEILPLLTELASIAAKVINGVGSVYNFFSGLMTSDSDKTVSQLNDKINQVEALTEKMQSLGDQSFQSKNLKGALGIPEDADLAQVNAYLEKLQGMYDQKERPTTLTVTPNHVTLPSSSGATDPVDRAINSLRRHTEQQIADTQAVGLGDAALAAFRATAQETAAIQANGGKETAAQAAQFAVLKQAAADAAAALEQAKVASQIDFGGKTMLLSSDDVAIATQLKGIYGNDVPAALASSDAAALRLNSTFKGLSAGIESDLVSGLTDIVDGTKSASQGWADLGTAMLKTIDQMIIKIAIVEPLMRALQASISGSGLLGFLGGGASAALPGTAGSPFFGPAAPSALGNVFEAGAIKPFALGGVVDSPTIAPMALFGEAGPEAIMPLKRGADGSLGVAGGSAPSPIVNVTLVENPNAQGGVSQRANSNGGLDIEVAVAQISAKSAATPGAALNRVMIDQLGSRQALAKR